MLLQLNLTQNLTAVFVQHVVLKTFLVKVHAGGL